MSNCKNFSFQFCICSIALLVLLRVAIGWHFFYEGLHKFDPAEGFSAKGFLGVAKGPTAEFYFAFLPDLSSEQRLVIGTVKDEKTGREIKTFIVYEEAWNKFYTAFLKHFSQIDQAEADKIFNRYRASMRAGAADEESDIVAFKASLNRFREMNKIPNDAPYEGKRRFDSKMGYRAEGDRWTGMLEKLGGGLESDLCRLANPKLAGTKGSIVTVPEKGVIKFLPVPVVKTQMQAMDLAVMYALTAIGLCMMLGFCNRLACLGGAAFLVNVVMTTYPVPGVYPPMPSAVGNFLFVSKDVVELIAMLFLASVPAGRWGGLDYFLWNCGGKQFVAKFKLDKLCPCCCEKNQTVQTEDTK
ncbi:MAG: hypothetical protein FWE67_14295 [Planctomycetaceae bacterium]|nr:hypothetical protein [Planctomycetaceae bacterium]